MANLKAGLIGLGMMGRHHARVLASLEGVDLVGVADPAGDPHGVAGGRAVLGSIDELIETGIDYCMVAVPTIYHEEVGLKLAAAGVHAIIEKPLAPDVASATRLAEAFEKAGLVGAVGHIERYNPSLQEARRRIEAGDLGRVFQVTTRRQNGFPARIADVGVVKDLATHDIDLTAWVTQQEFVWVQARTAHRAGRDHEDLVSAVGQLADGTVTNHLVNWLSPFKERVTVITGGMMLLTSVAFPKVM
jgi:predicted dehydrogenase